MFPERWWNLLFGSRGERLAARLLKQKGFRILARNCRSRFGELDLIARDGDTIVFVEVKTRSQSETGRPEDAITEHKRRQMTRAALAWLHKNRLDNHRCRFDVIAIVWGEGEPQVDHYMGAFDATS